MNVTKTTGCLLVLAALVVASTVAVGRGIVAWPEWAALTTYPDAVGDAVDPSEDMTVCYIGHDETAMYVRVEYQAGDPGVRGLWIYLDLDQDPGTGDDGSFCGVDLHGIGADKRIQVNDPWQPADGVYTFSAWFKTGDITTEISTTYTNIKVALADLGPPTFPIDIVFVSSLLGGTDWNPQSTYITYPPPVGGTILPPDLPLLTAPILVLALLATAILVHKRRHP